MLSEHRIREILQEWSFWDKPIPPPKLTRTFALPERLYDRLILVIQGVRRCGKSTLLKQLPAHYGLPLAQCYFCNFEDPQLWQDLDYNLLRQIMAVARKDHPPEMPCYFFFDEIQNVFGWEKWLHVQLERPSNNYFVVTGSNAHLLSGEFATALTGRHLTLSLYPLSFFECLNIDPQQRLEDYFITGGFPESVLLQNPTLLKEYFDNIILRDVFKRVQGAPEAIRQVVKMAFDCSGSELSYRKIAAVTQLTVATVKSYLEACEEAYMLFACPYFSFSEKKRASRHRKYYAIDPGLRGVVTGTAGRDFGKNLELLVFLSLKRKYEQVCYWSESNAGEIDFVVMEGQKIIPYQVTWEGVEARHEKALENFYRAFPQAEEAIFITQDNFSEVLLFN